jgi:glucose/arabinose dehydrogenase
VSDRDSSGGERLTNGILQLAAVALLATGGCKAIRAEGGVATTHTDGVTLPLRDPGRRFALRNRFPGVRLQNPVFAIIAPGAPSAWLVGEREGRILAIPNTADGAGSSVVLDLRSRTLGWQDVGLLNLVLHPAFGDARSPHRGEFFVWYNYTPHPHPGPDYPLFNTPSWTRLSRFSVAQGTLVADPKAEEVLLEQPRSNTDHMGGGMFFHPRDGFLYIAIGDGGHEFVASKLGHGYTLRELDDPQRIDRELLGGVLRIDVDRRGIPISHPISRQPRHGRTQGYFIPNDNPFADRGGKILEEFFAVGLRNPHRMTYDRGTDRIFVGDIGDVSFEEINVIEPGGNYQWSYKE